MDDPRVADRVEEFRMEFLKYGYTQVATETGLHHVRFDVSRDMAGMVVARMEAEVLAEDGGEPVEAKAFYWTKTRPRWLPRWLWRRIPEQREVTVQRVRPMWTYPQAAIALPALGRPIMKRYPA